MADKLIHKARVIETSDMSVFARKMSAQKHILVVYACDCLLPVYIIEHYVSDICEWTRSSVMLLDEHIIVSITVGMFC